jgi:hypothetical protein
MIPRPTKQQYFRVSTPTDVRPELVDVHTFGHHSSKIVGGQRHWLFAGEAEARLFVTYVNRGEFRLKTKKG